MGRVAIREGLFTVSGESAPCLLGGHCSRCRRLNFPAQTLCPYCSTDGCDTVPLSPRGVVEVCTTVINRPPGYEGPLPFGFGVVELPEGIRLISRMAQPERCRAGTPVRLILEPLCTDAEGREVVTYAFEPVGS